MDLYVERQSVACLINGDAKPFMLLFDTYFLDVFKYVRRRVLDQVEAERIVRLTFLDALGQMRNTPTDLQFNVWLYSLAKPRVWTYLNKSSFPKTQGLILVDLKDSASKEEVMSDLDRADKMFKKLSLEEREIIRLKFFEELTDAEVMYILDLKEPSIGSRIYRVLKRAHLLLFGEGDEKKGIYFGELSAFLANLRDLEKFDSPGTFKLTLKAELASKIERKDFSMDADLIEEKNINKKSMNTTVNATGSNDPAKIFVKAVQEMKQEEMMRKIEAEKDEYDQEFAEMFDRWKGVLIFVPLLLIFVIGGYYLFKNVDFSTWFSKKSPVCTVDVNYDGYFSDIDKASVTKGISDRLCEHFDVSRLMISKNSEDVMDVNLDIEDWLLEYEFVNKNGNWRIKKYERTFIGNS